MPRRGYSLVELIAVLAAVIILGAVLVPAMTGLGRDTATLAAADLVRGRVADARGAAVGTGRRHQLWVAADGTRVRLLPVDDPAADLPPGTAADDPLPPGVTARVAGDAVDGWVLVATFLPDGTCAEVSAAVTVGEPGAAARTVRVRGLTGSAVIEAEEPL